MRVCALIMKDDVYGRRIVEKICEKGFSYWIQWIQEFEVPLDTGLLDNPGEHLPKDLPECNLILSLGLPSDLQYTLPILAGRIKAKAVIAPIDDPRWIPLGLRRQIERALGDGCCLSFS